MFNGDIFDTRKVQMSQTKKKKKNVAWSEKCKELKKG